MKNFLMSVLLATVFGGIIGFACAEPLVEAIALEGVLASLTVVGAGLAFASLGSAAGAVLGVVFWAIGPILKLLPIGHN